MVLTDLPAEPEALARVGRTGIPTARPHFGSREDGEDLRQGAERPSLTRPGRRLMVSPVCRPIVAEVKGRPSGKEERQGRLCDACTDQLVHELVGTGVAQTPLAL